jgi:uncharacterized protein YutD
MLFFFREVIMSQRNQQEIIESIAQEFFHVETLNTRYSDSQDFYDCAVWNIKDALEKAYEAGRQDILRSLSLAKNS